MIVDYKKEHPKKALAKSSPKKALAKTTKSSPKKRIPKPKNGINVELRNYCIETTIRKDEFTFNFNCVFVKYDADNVAKWKEFIQKVNLKKYASITASDYEVPREEISLSNDSDEFNSFDDDEYIYHGINYYPDGTLIFNFEAFPDQSLSSFTIKGRDVNDFITKLTKVIG